MAFKLFNCRLYMKALLSILFILSFVACSTVSEKQLPQNTAGQEHQGHQAKHCETASIVCSETVNASFDPNGTLWLAWVNNNQIYVQSSDGQGKTLSEPVVVNRQPESVIAHDEYRPKVESDGKGHVYLTWTMALEKRHTGHIRFSRSIDGGKTFSEPVTVNDNLDVISHRFDSLALGKNGEVFVAWLDARDKEKAKANQQEHKGSSIYYTWSDNAGKSFYPNQLVAEYSCECCRLATAVDQDNLPVIAWRHVFDGEIRDHGLIKFTSWKTPGDIRRMSDEQWHIDACPHHGPGLSIAEDGSYHAVWFSGAADKQGLFYAHSNDGGHSFSPAVAFGGAGAGHPHVVALGSRVAIVWSEFDGKQRLVKLMQSHDGGVSWSAATQQAATTGNADYPFLLTNGQSIYLSWKTAEDYRFVSIDE